MKKTVLCLLIILNIIFPIFSITADASENEPKVIRIAVSDDENIIIERIIYAALKRLGYDVVVSSMGMKTAIISVDNGENDLLAVQALGIEDIYTNLVPVEVPISYVDMVTYTRTDSEMSFDSWDDLNGLRVVYHTKNTHVENHIPAGADKTSYNDYNTLYNAVLDGEADVLVMPVTELNSKIVPAGIKESGIVQVVETFSFVNKSLPYLAKQLETEFSKMYADGTISNIKNSITNSSSNEKIVLHISSYSSEMLWENSLVQGVKDSLGDNDNITYYNMSLNLKRLSNTEAQYELMAKSIHATFVDMVPDVIITSDNNALEFVVDNYSILFNNTPVIYCGVNNFEPEMIFGYSHNIRGLREITSAADTVDEMLKLFPDTKNIYILNDYTATGIMARQGTEKELEKYSDKINFIYNSNDSLTDIMKEISSLGKNTLVLCSTFYIDRTGKYFSEQELSETLDRGISNPVFSLSAAYIGYEVMLGGRVTDGYNQGHEAGKLALEVLAGKTIDELVIDDSTDKLNIWKFDYKALSKSGLKANQLPDEHIAVNKELSLFESNPIAVTLLLSLLGFSLLIAVVVSFFALVLRRKNTSLQEAQKSLHSAEELLAKDKQIRRSQADLYALLNTVIQPVMVADSESGNLLYVNDAYVNLFAFKSRAEALEYNITDISEQFKMQVKNYTEPFEWDFLSQNSSQILGQVMVSNVKFNDRASYAVIIQDITADRLKTQMLEKAADLERKANEMKSQFVVNMSHELRTPMNAIIGFSQIALRKNFEKDAHEMFNKINNSAKLLLDLIIDVLDFSKIEANKIELFIEEFEIESVLKDTLTVIAPRIENKAIELVLDIDENLPQLILGDKTRVWQILKNILDNSAKFTEKGRISLAVKLAEKQPGSQKIAIEFFISDTGAGMSEEQLHDLYKPFEQFHKSKSAFMGTGLGMTITSQLIQLMNGQIDVSSALGKGTQTRIIIPFEVPAQGLTIKADRLKDNEAEEELPFYPDARVLLVEDNEINQEIAASILELFGINPVIAGNGKEAIDFLEKQHFDLVFMDLIMPVMDGHEATISIRNSGKPYKDVPIVAMSANVVKEEIELCLKNGMNGHIGKPIDFKLLVKNLKLYL